MAANGKALVIGSALKVDRPFKASTITQMTGLSRQLVYGHLTNLVQTGCLEKLEKYYIVRDKEGLLNSLIEAGESVDSGLPKPGGFFSADATKLHNARLQLLVAARALDLPMSLEARTTYIQKLDTTIALCRQMKKYLTTSTKTVGSAQKFMKKEVGTEPELLWKMLADLCKTDITVDLPEFAAAYYEALEGEKD